MLEYSHANAIVQGINKVNIMSQHQYTYTPAKQESKLEALVIVVSCLAVFALWGVLLALGV
jgi:hypothetical protein